jgi:hypothetical protein
MSRRVAHRHADWLSLVEATGSFVTVPVLNRVFPNGVDHLDSTTRALVRQHLPADLRDVAANTAWTDWVLTDLLRWGNRLRSGPQVPATLNHVVGEHRAVLRPDYVLVEPAESGEKPRALVCRWPYGTNLTTKLPGDRWSASPAERMSLLCRATGVPLGFATDGNEWHIVWSPADTPPGTARFFSSLFSEEPALLDAFVSLFGAKRFFGVKETDTVEAVLAESATAQEEVAEQLGKQVRYAVELLIAAISRANRERDGLLLAGHTETEIYTASVTVMMRMVFLLFAEERGLLPLDEDFYARFYALVTLRESLQAERDQFGDEPLERRSTAWSRLLALFRAVHGGITHEDLRIPPYGGRLFDPDRFPFLEGRPTGTSWHQDESRPIPVDDLTVLAILNSLQVLEIREGGIREARQLSYRALEVEQIGHVYEGLLDHSVKIVDQTMLGLIGKAGDEPEVLLNDLERHAALGPEALIAWLKPITGKTEAQLNKILESMPSDTDRQVLTVAVEHDHALFDRLLPYVGLLRRDLRELPIVLLAGSVIVTQTSARRDGGIEYTTRSLADEVAQYALEPLVYSPGPQDTPDTEQWRLRSSRDILGLKVCDPAVGSGAILVAAGRYLADRLIEAWEAEDAQEASTSPEELLVTARRAVADCCLYGVDRDPLAAEMAKLSLWLTTMSKDRPFTFLDHAIRVGDALLGVTDLDQIRWMHLDPSQGRHLHTNLFDYTGILEPLVQGALERRRRLADIRVITIRDAEHKARLTAEADADLEALRAVADLVVAASVATSTQKKTALDVRLLASATKVATTLEGDEEQRPALVRELRETAATWLNAGRPVSAPVRSCLHWPLEFPEVFLDREQPGFDAMVGNPPFIGGKKLSGAAGSDVREFLVRDIAGGSKGNADLVAYFFLRAASVSRSFGLLATNTIAQGDTSEVGLAQILDKDWVIHRALSSVPWPGRASLEISKVWVTSQTWSGRKVLDGTEVAAGIDEMLSARSRSGWRKLRLAANAGRSFKGVNLNGIGFVVSLDEAAQMIAEEPRAADVLKPYVNGQDLNSNPTHSAQRVVIDYYGHTRESAATYLRPWDVVMSRVKPDRDRLPLYKSRVRDHFWLFEFNSAGMRRALEEHQRVFAIAVVSKTVLPAFVPCSQLYSQDVVVFDFDDDFHFGVLTSGFHNRWVIRHGSTLETRVRYASSDVFETFAFPDDLGLVANTADALDSHRQGYMISADEGLTSTYNRFHDPQDSTPAIVKLRELHVALDHAVRDAYGWEDLDLGHGFHPVRGQGTRFTFAPEVAEEILERLLELNKERYEAEVAAGLHAATKRVAPKKPVATPSGVPTLFEDDDGDHGEDEDEAGDDGEDDE